MNDVIPFEGVKSKFQQYVAKNENDYIGRHILIFFPNGYGASIVYGRFSYGLELAVITGTKDDYNLCYDTPVTDNVLGYLEIDQLDNILDQIFSLPPASRELHAL